jgi:hypothetical protein
LLRIISAPVRFWRYLIRPPNDDARKRFEAMTPQEKEQRRWQSVRRQGLFLTFVDMKPRGKPKRAGQAPERAPDE